RRDRRRGTLRLARVSLAVRRGHGPFLDHPRAQRPLGPCASALPRGVPMSRVGGHFVSRRRRRRLAGVAFGAACFAATLTGVVVLSVLLISVVSAALGRPPAHAWFDVAGNARELFAFLASLTQRFQRTNANVSGFKAGIAGSLWLLGL